MKKAILFLISFASVIIANAQGPTLISANAGYAVGDIYNHRSCDSTSITAGNSGAGVVWDYSTLNITGSITSQTCINSSGTPYASGFPFANIAIEDPADYYTYYLSNNSGLTMLGQGNTSYTAVYSDPQKILVFPFSYGSDFTDNLAATYTSAGVVYTRSGTSQSEGDGWGTLMLPGQTFNNVLRVKLTQVFTDQSTNGPISYYLQSYYWYDGIHKIPLLTIDDYFITIDGNFCTFKMVAINPDVVGITEPVRPEISVSLYPNPAKDVLNISSSAKIAGIKLFNVYGQLVLSNSVNNANTAINTGNYADGMYYLQFETKDGVITKNVSIRK